MPKKVIIYFKSFFIFLLCLFYRIIRGKANKLKKIEKILIIQPCKIGDMVCITPLFRAIKNIYPNANIFVAAKKELEELVKYNPYVNSFFSLEKRFYNQLKFIFYLRKKKIDFGISIQPAWEWAGMLYLSGIPSIVLPEVINGQSPYTSFIYRIQHYFFNLSKFKMKCYAPAEYLKLLNFINIYETFTKKDIFFSEEYRRKAKYLLNYTLDNSNKKVLVGIFPSCRNKLKNWGTNKFSFLIMELLNNYKDIVIFIMGGKEDVSDSYEIQKALSKKITNKVINTCGKFRLEELCAFLFLLDIIIGVDTGPIYIAEALNKYTIDITGPVDENEQPPVSSRNFLVFNKEIKCRPCSFVMNTSTKCKRKDMACLKTIKVENVVEVFDKIYDEIVDSKKKAK